MVSAVVLPQSTPSLPRPVTEPVSVRDLAAAGNFRAIALWLNQPLTTQGIFVQVQARGPGCLQITVEFQRSPIRDRLVRFICHRIWQLDSEVIQGIHILARPMGWHRAIWEQRIRIVSPALKGHQVALARQPVRTERSSLSPTLATRARRRRPLANRQLKTLRAFILSGSAVAAFILGCALEVTTSLTPSLPSLSASSSQSSPSNTGAPVPSGESTPTPATTATALPVSPSPSVSAPSLASQAEAKSRPTVVDAALEPVGVAQYTKPGTPGSDQITLLFGGDISLENLDNAQNQGQGGFFADVQDYQQADVSMVNLTTPLATAATSLTEELHHKTRPEAVDLLAKSGIDIVNLTNSNLMEYGEEGLAQTLTALDSKGVYRVGAGRNAMEARRPEILDVKGKRIAYLSYAMGGKNAAMDTTALQKRAGAKDRAVVKELESFKRSTAFRDRAGLNAQNMPQIVEDLKAIRKQVDWIVVNFRWVDKISSEPNFVQTNLARLAIDQGADLVVGYHPNVIQGAEIYKGKPIAYSLGDFVFKPDKPIEDQDSAMLKVALQGDQMRVEFVPVQVRDSRPKTLTGPEAEAVLQKIQAASAQFQTPMQSPLVLNRQAPVSTPQEAPAPDSSFVNPGGGDTLPVPPSPSEIASPQASPTSPATPKEAAPKDLEKSGESQPSSPSPAVVDPLPALQLPQDINHQLQQWGPKVSPKQKEFQPIPQNRSGAGDDRSISANPLPVDTHQQSQDWSDRVPAQPLTPQDSSQPTKVAEPSTAPDIAVTPVQPQV
ncbi:MAG: CapA family protein [Cyanobacteria bacterium REEB459]|nr:CapA family protein [Cyanobacteria bacterium REEB459]